MLNFIIDNEFCYTVVILLLEIEEKEMLSVICSIRVIRYVHTVEIIKVDILNKRFRCSSFSSSNIKSFMNF